MFEVIFLGHQGWLVRDGQTTILIDPLLTDSFGHGGSIGAVYPPRAFDFQEFPRVDAVLLPHEHEDHFDIPSLSRLERGIPILLSRGASSAARAILHEMGHDTILVGAGETVRVHTMEMFFFAPDHVRGDFLDEWEVLQFFVRDIKRTGSFCSCVDAPFSTDTYAVLSRLSPLPGIIALANNMTDFSCLEAGAAGTSQANPFDVGTMVLQQLATLVRYWGVPSGTLMCGGGFSFGGSREWMNTNVFSVSSELMCNVLNAAAPSVAAHPVLPGQGFRMDGRELIQTSDATPFLRTCPKSQWPSKAFLRDVRFLDTYESISPSRELSEADLDELTRELADFARFLYGGPIFRGLYSLNRRVDGKIPTFAFALLLSDTSWIVFEYQPQSCSFIRTNCADPGSTYISGVECWAADLLSLFRGEYGPTAVVFGRGRAWNLFPNESRVQVNAFWNYFHPLRRADQFLKLYRRLYTQESHREALVRRAELPNPCTVAGIKLSGHLLGI